MSASKTKQGSLSLAERMMIRHGELMRRSDVAVPDLTRRNTPPLSKWKRLLPQDLLEFLQVRNGLVCSWRFADEEHPLHGPVFLTFATDGQSVTDPRTGSKVLPLCRHGDCALALRDENGEPWPDDDLILMVEGDEGSGGIILRNPAKDSGEYFHWNSDGETRSLGTSFTKIIEDGMASAFAATWLQGRDGEDHPLTKQVVERLAQTVPLRETFHVKVDEVDRIGASDYRQWMGRPLENYQLMPVMRAFKRKGKVSTLDAKARGELLDELTASADDLDKKTIRQVLKAVGWSKKFTKKEFVKRFRCDGKEMLRVVFEVKRLNGTGLCGIHWSPNTNNALVRMLHEHPDLHVTDEHSLHPDVISYVRVEGCEPFFHTNHRDFRWAGEDSDTVRFEALFEPHLGVGLEVGLEFRSQALQWIP